MGVLRMIGYYEYYECMLAGLYCEVRSRDQTSRRNQAPPTQGYSRAALNTAKLAGLYCKVAGLYCKLRSRDQTSRYK
eukprot:3828986-Rhodomonas_salina.3